MKTGENEFVTHRTLPYTSINIMTHRRRFVLNRPKYLFFVRDIVTFLFLITIYRMVRKSPTDAAFLRGTWHKLTQQTGDRKILLFILVVICCRLMYVWHQKSNIEIRGAFHHVFTLNTWWNLKHVGNLGYATKQWHSGEMKGQ